jgi:hypothetical protein
LLLAALVLAALAVVTNALSHFASSTRLPSERLSPAHRWALICIVFGLASIIMFAIIDYRSSTP